VGTDGQVLGALASAAAGVAWVSPTPNTMGGLPDGAKAATMNRSAVAALGGLAITSGTLYLVGITLAAGVPLNSISMMSGAVALAAGTHQFFGVFDDGLGSSSGVARALLRGTNDDTSAAWGTQAVKTLTLTSAYTPTRSGFFYVGLLVVATTTPTVKAFGADTFLAAIPSVASGVTTSTGLIALPNPSAAPAAGNAIYAYVS